MKSILKYLLVVSIGLYASVPVLAINNTIRIYLHNCPNSSRMIIVHIFNGNISQKFLSDRNLPINYNWLSQQKNLGAGESVAVQCHGQGKRRCIVKSEDGDFIEVRREDVLYFYHYLKDDRGITKISTNPHLCGPNYKPITKPHLKV